MISITDLPRVETLDPSCTDPTLLLVEGEPSVRRFVVRALRHQDLRILKADTLEGAKQVLHAARVSVLLTDDELSDGHGVELLRHARATHPSVVRMLITASDDLRMAVSAVNEGGVLRFLRKPCSEAEVQMAVRFGLRKSRHRDDSRPPRSGCSVRR